MYFGYSNQIMIKPIELRWKLWSNVHFINMYVQDIRKRVLIFVFANKSTKLPWTVKYWGCLNAFLSLLIGICVCILHIHILVEVIHRIWKLWALYFQTTRFFKIAFWKPIYWSRDLLMQPTGTVWTTLVGDHPGIIPVKFG